MSDTWRLVFSSEELVVDLILTCVYRIEPTVVVVTGLEIAFFWGVCV